MTIARDTATAQGLGGTAPGRRPCLKLAALTCCATLIIITCGLTSLPAFASALSARECLRLEKENKLLKSADANGHLKKGPVWAKANLTPEQLRQVEKLIDATAALKFRCDNKIIKALKKRMNQPRFKKWQVLNPPLPSRNPKFVALSNH